MFEEEEISEKSDQMTCTLTFFFFPSEQIHVRVHSSVDVGTTLEYVDHDSSTRAYFISHGVTV